MLLRSIGVVGAAAVCLSLAAGPASAKGGKQTVEGKLTWSVTTTTVDPGDPTQPSRTTQNETVQEEFSLRLKAVRDPRFTRTYVFKRSKAAYTYSSSGTRVTDDFSFNQLNCKTTTTTSLAGSGTTDISASIFGKYKPNRDVLVIDKRTKGISVQALLPGSGTSTTTFEGFGTSPCENGSYTDPEQWNGSTSLNDSRWICAPSGLSRIPSGQRPLYGAWNQKKKRFDFACSKQFVDGNGTTQRLTVAGSLAYKR
jgi:hypothetical protein